MSITAEVIVLGVGPGGEQVVGDLLAAGTSVVAIEAELVGGECPYWGCIPSKIALRAATTLAEAAKVNQLAGEAIITADWAPVAARIRSHATDNWNDDVAVKRITDAGGTFVRGRGVITGARNVEVNGERYVATKALVVATGTTAAIPAIEGLSDIDYWTNREALRTTKVPASMVVLGGGAVGCELGQLFARFGSAVTIVESAPRLLALEEPEVGPIVAASLANDGIAIRTGVGATKVTATSPVTVELSDGSAVSGDVVLVATGRKVDLGSIGADTIGAGPEQGHIRALPVDDYLRVLGPEGMPIDGVYAIGDMVGMGAFTHVATTHGRMVSDQILGKQTLPFSQRTVSRATFTDPEVGAVGLSEKDARAQGLDVEAVTFPMASVSRGYIHGPGSEGIFKLVVDKQSRTVVGGVIVGPHGGEILSGLTVAVAGKVPLEALITTVWAFPTFARGFDSVLAELSADLRPIR